MDNLVLLPKIWFFQATSNDLSIFLLFSFEHAIYIKTVEEFELL